MALQDRRLVWTALLPIPEPLRLKSRDFANAIFSRTLSGKLSRAFMAQRRSFRTLLDSLAGEFEVLVQKNEELIAENARIAAEAKSQSAASVELQITKSAIDFRVPSKECAGGLIAPRNAEKCMFGDIRHVQMPNTDMPLVADNEQEQQHLGEGSAVTATVSVGTTWSKQNLEGGDSDFQPSRT